VTQDWPRCCERNRDSIGYEVCVSSTCAVHRSHSWKNEWSFSTSPSGAWDSISEMGVMRSPERSSSISSCDSRALYAL